jgi:hypothetical protein
MSDPKYTTERLKGLLALDNSPSFISTLNKIQEFGWSALMIGGERQSDFFAYTVGLYDTLGFPELIVIGLKHDLAHAALGYAVTVMKSGIEVRRQRVEEILGNVTVEFRPVAQKWFRHVMCRADWYYGYGKTEVPALQIIYPDIKGRFQWEPEFDERFRQPLLQAEAWGRTEEDFWASNDPTSSLFDWKFPDDPHTTAYLSKTVQDKEETVTYVSHDRDDGDWQFLGDKMSDGGGPVISCLHHPIDNDPSLKELFDLPIGWYAVRKNQGSSWERFELPDEQDEVPSTPALD